MFVDYFGSVFTCGANSFGQLGTGDLSERENPTKLPQLPSIKLVSLGNYHSLLLDSQGKVWSFGSNIYGQLGLGPSIEKENVPTLIQNLPIILSIAAGYCHSLFLDENGFVWSCGLNENGQLGTGETNNVFFARKIPNLHHIKSVYAGGGFSLFLDANGSLWVCGSNECCQSGSRFNVQKITPEKMPNFPTILSISTGFCHSLFLDTRGIVWGTGFNGNGELGLGDLDNREQPHYIETLPCIKEITAGCYHSLFLDSQGGAWSCGFGGNGRLGLGEATTASIPVKIQNIPPITRISAGVNHSILIDQEDKVWVCGSNKFGQLGLGDKIDRFVPCLVENLPKIQAFQLSREESFIPRSITETWQQIRERKEQVNKQVEETKKLLAEKQRKLQELMESIENTREIIDESEAILRNQSELPSDCTADIIYPAGESEVEEDLLKQLKEKLESEGMEKLTVEDLCVFLQFCGMSAIIPYFRSQSINGEELKLFLSTSDFTGIGIDDILLEKQLEFFTKLLDCKLLFSPDVLEKSEIWQHRSPELTMVFLENKEIALPPETISQKGISICQLIFFDFLDIQQMFQLNLRNCVIAAKKLKLLKKEFKIFLKTEKSKINKT